MAVVFLNRTSVKWWKDFDISTVQSVVDGGTGAGATLGLGTSEILSATNNVVSYSVSGLTLGIVEVLSTSHSSTSSLPLADLTIGTIEQLSVTSVTTTLGNGVVTMGVSEGLTSTNSVPTSSASAEMSMGITEVQSATLIFTSAVADTLITLGSIELMTAPAPVDSNATALLTIGIAEILASTSTNASTSDAFLDLGAPEILEATSLNRIDTTVIGELSFGASESLSHTLGYTINMIPTTVPGDYGNVFVDGEDVLENEVAGYTVTGNNLSINTTYKKYGNSSLYTNNNGYFTVNGLSSIGSGDFSFDYWFRTGYNIFQIFGNSSATNLNGLRAMFSGNSIWIHGNGARFFNATGISGYYDNQWHHIAITRVSGVWHAYLDGVEKISEGAPINTTPAYTTNSNFTVGKDVYSNYPLQGYMDNIRFSIGTSLFTSNFDTSSASDLSYEIPGPDVPELDGTPQQHVIANATALLDLGVSEVLASTEVSTANAVAELTLGIVENVSSSISTDSVTNIADLTIGITEELSVTAICSNQVDANLIKGITEVATSTTLVTSNVLTSELTLGGPVEVSDSISIQSTVSSYLTLGVTEPLAHTAFSMVPSGIPNTGTLYIDGDSPLEDENGTHTLINNGVTLNTSIKKYGSSSLYFDGTTHLRIDDSDDWDFSNGDFTIDFWFRFTDVSGSQFFVSQYDSDTSRWQFYVQDGGEIVYFSINGGPLVLPNNDPFIVDTWYHFAIVRAGNVWTVYRNGVAVKSETNSGTLSNISGPLYIGRYAPGGYNIKGYMDNFRLTKGTALWTSGFSLDDASLHYSGDPVPNVLSLVADSETASYMITGIDELLESTSNDITSSLTADLTFGAIEDLAHTTTSLCTSDVTANVELGIVEVLATTNDVVTSVDSTLSFGAIEVLSHTVGDNDTPGGYSNDIVPVFTSYNNLTSGNVTLFGTGQLSSTSYDRNITRAFYNDGSTGLATTNNFTFSGGVATATQYFGVQFNDEAKLIAKYSIEARLDVNGKSWPKSWTFEGSNNGSDYTVLDTQTDVIFNPDIGEKKEFTFINSNTYSYYRIGVTANGGDHWCDIAEIELMEYTEPIAETYIVSAVTTPSLVLGTTETLSHVCFSRTSGSGESGVLFIDAEDNVIEDENGHVLNSSGVNVNNIAHMYGDGSLEFDGSSYITSPVNNDFNLGSGDFTIDGWFYKTTSGNDGTIFHSNGSWALRFNSNTSIRFYYFDGASRSLDFTIPSSVQNVWTHLAVTRSSGSLRVFINGTQIGSTQTVGAINNNTTTDLYIGSSGPGSYFYQGFADNLRIVKGTALWTTTFDQFNDTDYPVAGTTNVTKVVAQSDDSALLTLGHTEILASTIATTGAPTAGLSLGTGEVLESTLGVSTSNVSANLELGGPVEVSASINTVSYAVASTLILGVDELLSHTCFTQGTGNLGGLFIDGESVFEDETGNHTVTPYNGAVISSAQSALGSSSMSFPGSSYVKTSDSNYFDIGSGAFTVDLWFYLNSTSGGQTLFNIGNYDSVGLLCYINTMSLITFYMNNGSNQWNVSVSLTNDTWYHMTLVRNASGSSSVYIDGVHEATNAGALTGSFNSNGNGITLGVYSNLSTNPLNGYIDNFRIVTGEALWTSDFNINDSDEMFYSSGPDITKTVADSDVSQTASLLLGQNEYCTSTCLVNSTASAAITLGITEDLSHTCYTLISGTGPETGVLYIDGETVIEDDSSQNHSLTMQDVQLRTVTKARGTGSVYFIPNDPSYIEVTDGGSDFTFTGDFTIDWWMNSTYNGQRRVVFSADDDTSTTSDPAAFWFEIGADDSTTFGFNVNTELNGGNVNNNSWQHWAVQRVGNRLTIFRNGTPMGHTFYTGTIGDPTKPFRLGKYGTFDGIYMAGYIDNFRVVKGTALFDWSAGFNTSSDEDMHYTGQGDELNITETLVQSANSGLITTGITEVLGLATLSNTNIAATLTLGVPESLSHTIAETPADGVAPDLFIDFEDNVVEDEAGNHTFIDSTNVTFNTDVPNIVGGNYSGNIGWFTVTDSDTWYLEDSDFTIDFWLRPTHDTYGGIISAGKVIGGQDGYRPWLITISNYNLSFYIGNGGGSNWAYADIAMGTGAQNTWSHFAITRSGNNIRTFKDGDLISITDIGTFSFANPNENSDIGRWIHNTGTIYYSGQMDNIRIIKGQALWTSNFDEYYDLEYYSPSVPAPEYSVSDTVGLLDLGITEVLASSSSTTSYTISELTFGAIENLSSPSLVESTTNDAILTLGIVEELSVEAVSWTSISGSMITGELEVLASANAIVSYTIAVLTMGVDEPLAHTISGLYSESVVDSELTLGITEECSATTGAITTASAGLLSTGVLEVLAASTFSASVTNADLVLGVDEPLSDSITAQSSVGGILSLGADELLAHTIEYTAPVEGYFDVTGSGTASSSAGNPNNAFDDIYSTYTTVATSAGSGYLEYEFTEPRVITKYSLRNYNEYGPIIISLVGWNGSGWDTLHTINYGTHNVWNYDLYHEWIVSNSTAYTIYRINMTSDIRIYIREAQLMEYISIAGGYEDYTVSTADASIDLGANEYAATTTNVISDTLAVLTLGVVEDLAHTAESLGSSPGVAGTVDQCSGGTVTASYDSANSYNAFVNGVDWTAYEKPMWIQYNFAEAKQIGKITIRSGAAGLETYAPKTFDIYGTNDDTNFDLLHSVSNLSDWNTWQYRSFEFTNYNSYMSYRIHVYEVESSSNLVSFNDINMYDYDILPIENVLESIIVSDAVALITTGIVEVLSITVASNTVATSELELGGPVEISLTASPTTTVDAILSLGVIEDLSHTSTPLASSNAESEPVIFGVNEIVASSSLINSVADSVLSLGDVEDLSSTSYAISSTTSFINFGVTEDLAHTITIQPGGLIGYSDDLTYPEGTSSEYVGAIASVDPAYYPMWAVFDNIHGVQDVYSWRGSLFIDDWIGWDFGVGNEKVIERITIRNGNVSTDSPEQTIKDMYVEGYNGSSWELLNTFNGQSGWATSETRSFNINDSKVAYQSYRIVFTENQEGSQYTYISEIEFKEGVYQEDIFEEYVNASVGADVTLGVFEQLAHTLEIPDTVIPGDPGSPEQPGEYGDLFIDGEDATIEDENGTHTITTTGGTVDFSSDKPTETPGDSSLDFSDFSDQITISNSSAFALGTSNFTIDFWIKPNTSGSLWRGIYEQRYVDGSVNDFGILGRSSNGDLIMSSRSNGNYVAQFTASSVLTIGVWQHVAIVRYGTGLNNMKLFIDGVEKSVVWNTNLNINEAFPTLSTDPRIGYTTNAAAGTRGLIDNFRWIKGQALWTSNFDTSSNDDMQYVIPAVPAEPDTIIDNGFEILADSNISSDLFIGGIETISSTIGSSTSTSGLLSLGIEEILASTGPITSSTSGILSLGAIETLEHTCYTGVPEVPAETGVLFIDAEDNVLEDENGTHSLTLQAASSIFGARAFGDYGINLPTTSARIDVANHTDFNFGSGDFTIDFWFYSEAWTNGGFVQKMDNGANYSDISYTIRGNNGSITFEVGFTDNNGVLLRADDQDYGDETWHHIAATREGSTFRLFVDGILKDSDVKAEAISDTTTPLYIGAVPIYGANYGLHGFMDNFRIVKGEALFTSTFNPITETLYEAIPSSVNIIETLSQSVVTPELTMGITEDLSHTISGTYVESAIVSLLSLGVTEILATTDDIVSVTNGELSIGADEPLAHTIDVLGGEPYTYTDDLCTNGTPFASNTSSGRTPDRAFDDSNTDYLTDAWYTEGVMPVSIGYDFGTLTTISKYTISSSRAAGREPGTWEFQGSSDNSNWTTLDSVFSEDFAAGETKEYTIDNTNSYRYYRLYITDNSGYAGSVVEIGEIEMMAKDGDLVSLASSLVTSELTMGGGIEQLAHTVSSIPGSETLIGYTNDIADYIPSKITGSTPWQAGREPEKAFDNQNGAFNSGYVFHTLEANKFLQYDFGVGNEKQIEKYTLTGEVGSYYFSEAPKTWSFEGSNNGSDWDVLDTQSEITNWEIGVAKEFTFNNSTSYRYYRWNNIIANNSNPTNDLMIGEAELMEGVYTSTPEVIEDYVVSTTSASLDIGVVEILSAFKMIWSQIHTPPMSLGIDEILTSTSNGIVSVVSDADLIQGIVEVLSTTVVSVAYTTSELTIGVGEYLSHTLDFIPGGIAYGDDVSSEASVSADRSPGGQYVPSKAIDDNTSTYWIQQLSGSALGTSWYKLNFGTGNEKVINKYTIQTYSIWYPKNVYFEGSNDNINWDVLDSRLNLTWANNELKEFTFENSTAYKLYRISTVGSQGMVGYREVQLMESYPLADSYEDFAVGNVDAFLSTGADELLASTVASTGVVGGELIFGLIEILSATRITTSLAIGQMYAGIEEIMEGGASATSIIGRQLGGNVIMDAKLSIKHVAEKSVKGSIWRPKSQDTI